MVFCFIAPKPLAGLRLVVKEYIEPGKLFLSFFALNFFVLFEACTVPYCPFQLPAFRNGILLRTFFGSKVLAGEYVLVLYFFIWFLEGLDLYELTLL